MSQRARGDLEDKFQLNLRIQKERAQGGPGLVSGRQELALSKMAGSCPGRGFMETLDVYAGPEVESCCRLRMCTWDGA